MFKGVNPFLGENLLISTDLSHGSIHLDGSIPWQDLMPEAKRKFDMKFGMPRKTTLLEVQG